MKNYKRVLTIAGSDSGGGAGIQADLKTIAANGCYGFSVITSITSQNTLGVKEVFAIPSEIVVSQLETVLEDIGVDAVKIGMMYSEENIYNTANILKKNNAKNIVVDPVMISTSGHKLIEDKAISALQKYLFPIADIITPNLPEAEVLLNQPITNLKKVIKDLTSFGNKAVILKAGHLNGKILTDVFYHKEEDCILELSSNRVETKNTHGTGCTLSSAIASFLAKGYSITEAVKLGKEYLSYALIAGKDYELGKGHGPVHHFYKFW